MRIRRNLLHSRNAFTLIELLVVMGIILVLVTIGYVVFPRRAERDMTFAASRLQSWLLSARSQAKRDNKATGVRIQFGSNNTATTLIYIQQPDPFPPPNFPTTCTTTGAGPTYTTLAFSPPTLLQGNAAFAGQMDLAPVEPGDYIYLPNAVPPINGILSVTGSNVTISPGVNSSWLSNPVTPPYQILRRPRPLLGEENLTLPDDIVIDFNLSSGIPSILVNATPNPVTVNEILFSPSGNVIGQNSGGSGGGGQVFIWLTNTGLIKAGTYSSDPTEALLIAIQVRTGLISVNPPGPTQPTAYQYAQNLRSSGM
jgi:prepilin-type N-terminal cleavage/methylation domain-containing protein